MNVPPYFSRTPPPLACLDEHENGEEFGNFVVCSDLGEEVFEVYEKPSGGARGEDNVSEDSGFCMNSCGQTQSPCDVSPLSSSYPNKGNDCETGNNPLPVLECGLNEKLIAPHSSVSQAIESNVDSDDEPLAGEVKGSIPGDINPSDRVEAVPSYGEVECNSSFSDLNQDLHNEVVTVVEKKWDVSCVDDNNLSTASKDLSQRQNDIEFLFSEDHPKYETNSESRSSCNASPFSYIKPDFCCTDPEQNDFFFQSTFENLAGPGILEEACPVTELQSEDDFTDFAEFQSSSNVLRKSAEEKCSNLKNQIPGLLLFEEETTEDIKIEINICPLQTVLQTSFVWNCLQSFEETPAFKYQWASSCTNLKFLKALQIDSRNILHGPWSKVNRLHWSDVPSRSETTFHTNFTETHSSALTAVHQESIPDPLFDWNSSGLVNPLQPTNTKHHTSDAQPMSSLAVHDINATEILASLPSFSFVKVQYIVFKK